MTIVAARLYRDGRRVADYAALDDVTPPDAPGELLWIGLNAPTPDELGTVARRLAFHPLAVEDALKAHQLPKVEAFGGHLFVVAYTAHRDAGGIRYGETALFVGARFIVTVRHGSPRDHAPVRAQLEAAPQLLAQGSDYVLHAILDHLVDGYTPVIEGEEEEVAALEDRAVGRFLSAGEIAALFHRRRELMRFQRRIEPMADVAAKLAAHDLPCIDAEARPYFRDVHDHVRRALHRTAELRDALSGIIETSGLLEMQRQGVITRQLAAWAAILAVPTAIAGIYGMNFDVMPELRWRFGYPAVVAAMAGICGWLYWRFRRSGWL